MDIILKDVFLDMELLRQGICSFLRLLIHIGKLPSRKNVTIYTLINCDFLKSLIRYLYMGVYNWTLLLVSLQIFSFFINSFITYLLSQVHGLRHWEYSSDSNWQKSLLSKSLHHVFSQLITPLSPSYPSKKVNNFPKYSFSAPTSSHQFLP